MIFRVTYIAVIFSLLFGLLSCVTRKEYIEKNGLHSDAKPSEIAKEMGHVSKGQKRAYRKLMYKQWKKYNPGKRRKDNPYR